MYTTYCAMTTHLGDKKLDVHDKRSDAPEGAKHTLCGAQHAMQWSVGNVVLDSAHLNKKTE